MAKAQKAGVDVSAEFITSLNDLQKAANRANFSKFQTTSRGAAADAKKGADVCGVYIKVRPFLEIIKRIPFIPAKVKEGLTLLMSALDVMCPR
jgi:hypothetical protein